MRNIILIAIVFIAQSAFAQISDTGNTYFNVPAFQSNKNEPYNVATPNQSELGTYGIIHVSQYTGKADVSIPIFSTNQRGVALDVRLCYDTSGLLINQLPGWTGHNWTLLAGGAITRKVNGRPDEVNYQGTGAGKDIFSQLFSDEIYCTFLYNLCQVYGYDLDIDFVDEQYRELLDLQRQAEQQDMASYSGFTNYFSYAQYSLDDTPVRAPSTFDSSADVFYFNFMGISGSFFYGNDNNWKVQCNQNIDVIFDVSDANNYIDSYETYYWYEDYTTNTDGLIRQPKTIKGFTLVDERGNQYIFGGSKDEIEYSTSIASMSPTNTTEPWVAVSWMLKEVKDRFGNVLYSFDYSRGTHITQIQNSYCSYQAIDITGNCYPGEHVSPKAYNATINEPLYLDSISVYDGTKLIFNHANAYSSNASRQIYTGSSNTYDIVYNILYASYPRMRYQSDNPDGLYYDPYADIYMRYMYAMNNCNTYIDNMNLEKLNTIRIVSPDATETGSQDQVYNFLYDFNNRMHLTSLSLSCDNEHSYSYEFDYDRFDSIPSDYLTKQVDYWGYYNGVDYDVNISQADSSENYITMVSNHGQNTPLVPNLNYGTMGMLRKITYPTGGYSFFEYEQNTCRRYMSTDKQSVIDAAFDIPVGGLRIKKISNYDNGYLVGRKEYSYTIPTQDEREISSGELYAVPKTHYQWSDNSYIYKVSVFNAAAPMANTFAPSVGYSYVKETNLDDSFTTYAFTNFSTENDNMFDNSRFGISTITPFDEFSSRQYMCGQLVSKTVFECNGDSVSETMIHYASDADFNRNNYVATTCFNIHNLFTNVGSRYKIFYFRPHPERVVTKTKYGSSWVTDEMIYDLKHDTLTHQYTGGRTQSTDIWNMDTETYRRGSNYLKTEYTYPFDQNETSRNLAKQFCISAIGYVRKLNDEIIDGERTTYRMMGNFAVPDCGLAHAADPEVCDTIAKYVSFSPTYRITEMIDKDNVTHKLYWNDRDQLIANITNGSINVGNEYGNDNIMRANQNTIFSEKPTGADLYEYNQMGKVSRITTGNRLSAGYEYDRFGRLNKIKDTYGNTINRFSYNYRHNQNHNNHPH